MEDDLLAEDNPNQSVSIELIDLTMEEEMEQQGDLPAEDDSNDDEPCELIDLTLEMTDVIQQVEGSPDTHRMIIIVGIDAHDDSGIVCDSGSLMSE